MDYKKAGVNIDAGNQLVKSLGAITAQTARSGAQTMLGGFGSIFDLKQLDYKDPLLVSGTDGVGTKLKIAHALHKHDTIGQDLVAMCVNDILAQGAEPLFFLDYFATSKLEPGVAQEVIAGIAHACKKSNCALIGGETAEMPDIYQPGEYDLAGFVVGIVEREQLLPKKELIKPGDIVIGVASSGPHSNGYSLIRKILETNHISFEQEPPFETSYANWGELLLEPTHLYVSAVLPLIKQNLLKGIAHITGGGLLENIPRILPEHLSVELDSTKWHKPEIFNWLQKAGKVDLQEMYRVFNMGIGMTLITEQRDVDDVLKQLKDAEFDAYEVGKVVERSNEPVIIR